MLERKYEIWTVFAVVTCLAGISTAADIYVDDFDGLGSVKLNGTAPDTAPGGQTWTARTDAVGWNADGSKAGTGTSNAWLPFNPLPGNIYTLSAVVDPDISGSADWFAVGFGQSNVTTSWQGAPNNTVAWMLNREDDTSASAVQTFLGPVTAGGASHDFAPDKVGPVNMTVVLNTQAAAWTAEWFVDGASIRAPAAFGSTPSIEHVGIGANNTATGSIGTFTLSDAIGAVPLTDLFNTGVDASGNVIAPGGGATDPHWTITSSPAASGFAGPALVQSNHGAWLANDPSGGPGSSFISVVDTGTTNIPAGDYTFETFFDLTGFDPDSAALGLNIAADNNFDVFLNGNPTGLSGGGFAGFNGPLFITDGFQSGLNSLEIILNNAGTSDNPGGLRVELFGSAVSAAAVPEPASIAVWTLIGFVAIGFGWFRSRKRKA